MRTTVALFFAGVFLLTSCHHRDPMDSVKKKTMDMKEFEEDVTVPSGLWKAMESSYQPLVMDAEGKAVKDAAQDGKKDPNSEEFKELLKKKPPLDPIPLTVYLIEKTPGVLGGQNYELKYPAGGGLLDYRIFVPESKSGTFFFRVKFEGEMDPKETKIYYLSDARIRDVGGNPMGNGCNRYFDITTYWKKVQGQDGLVLNTADWRHISVTAGTLFFVAPFRGKLRIAHLTIKDSRHRDLLCSSEISN